MLLPVKLQPDGDVAAVSQLFLIYSVSAHTARTTAASIKPTLTPDKTPGRRPLKLRSDIMIFMFQSDYSWKTKYKIF